MRYGRAAAAGLFAQRAVSVSGRSTRERVKLPGKFVGAATLSIGGHRQLSMVQMQALRVGTAQFGTSKGRLSARIAAPRACHAKDVHL